MELSNAGDLTLTKGDDTYDALLDFTAPQGGSYDVRCQDEARPSQAHQLAVGESVQIFAGILLGLAAFLVGAGIATAIILITWSRRRSYKRRLQDEAAQRAAAGLDPSVS